MTAMKKILVPTDFSAHADEAFRVAHGLAKALGAEVVLFHIARPPAVVVERGGKQFPARYLPARARSVREGLRWSRVSAVPDQQCRAW